jgi:hypothetical protein
MADTAALPSSEIFEEFEQRLSLGARSYSRAMAKEIIGCGDTQFDEIVRSGELPGFRVGVQKTTFLGRDIARFLWSRRLPVGQPSAARKPRTEEQLTPPKRVPGDRQRGRRPTTTPQLMGKS